MSKRSKRPAREARDVHAAILAAAQTLKAASGRVGIRDGSEFPEVEALLHAARDAIGAQVPQSFVFEGRRYWIRSRLMAQIDVFAAPGDAEALLMGASFATDDYGHRPGH